MRNGPEHRHSAVLEDRLQGEKISGKTASEEIRNAKIQSMYRLDGKLILQGTQNAMAWSMVITEATQKMTLTASGDEAGFGGAESRYAAEAEILDSQTSERLASAVDRKAEQNTG